MTSHSPVKNKVQRRCKDCVQEFSKENVLKKHGSPVTSAG